MDEFNDNTRPAFNSGSGNFSRVGSEGRLGPECLIDGSYKLGPLLGRGGMGEVYQCRHLGLDKEYALKLLTGRDSAAAQRVILWKRFETEARAMARLNHENIVQIHNMGVHDGTTPYYVMDLVAGQTLADKLKAGPLPVEESLDIFIQVCHCLNFAHRRGIIHRDIKPANIMLNQDGKVKLLDFGLAKFTDTLAAQGLTAPGEVFGSPLYMSPEQAMGNRVDARSDIYSSAASLYEALTGKPPLVGKTAMETLLKIQTETAAPLNQAGCAVHFSPQLELILARALQKDPAERYQQIDLFGDDLRRLRQKRPLLADARAQQSTAADQEDAPQAAAPTCSVARILLLVGLLLPGGLTLWLLQQNQSRQPHFGSKPFLLYTDKTLRHYQFTQCPQIGGIATTNLAHPEIPDKNGILLLDSRKNQILVASSALLAQPDQLRRFSGAGLYGMVFSDGTAKQLESALDTIPDKENLQYLRLKKSALSAKAIGILAKFISLNRLSLQDVTINENALAASPLLPYLDKLQLSPCGNPRAILTALQSSRRIDSLDLSRSKLDRQDIKLIAAIKSITYLNLTGTGITDDALAPVATMGGLQTLNLQCNVITPRSLEVFRKLPNLIHLSLDEQSWSRESLEELYSLPCYRKKAPKQMGTN